MNTNFSERNKLVIIGNGFDLAHGMKTSYSDFLNFFIKQLWENCYSASMKKENIYKDCFIEAPRLIHQTIRREESLENIKNHFLNDPEMFVVRSRFLRKLIGSKEGRWVNIEFEFYEMLKKTFLKKINSSEFDSIGLLNETVEEITNSLKKYLQSLEISEQIDSIGQVVSKILSSVSENSYTAGKRNPNYYVVNFNYTSLSRVYFEKLIDDSSRLKINNIHGTLDDPLNPMIFGYGDESDNIFLEIEKSNDNKFLQHLKSYSYLKTSNYQHLMRYTESFEYDVIILGHSCGLSDRVLLKEIFENEKCKKIHIFYHQKSETENDYVEKTMEISRHFSDKASFRRKVVNFEESDPLIPYKPK